jgi:hypothetical protein
MDWHELEKMKVTDLREMAKDKFNLTGVTGLNKAALVEAIAKEMGIEKPHKVAEGANKTQIKQAIRAMKVKRNAAQEQHDKAAMNEARHEIHKLRRKLRKMSRLTH